MSSAKETAAPRPALSVFDAVMITTGIVIGAGIFKTPSMVAGVTGSVEWMLIAWVLGGVLSLVGALCYAELATTFPSAGGDYHFLTRAYGRNLSFFFAWARVTVITAGSIALLGFVFGDYMSRVLPLGPHSSAVWAAGLIVLLTALNLAGLKESAGLQNLMTVLLVCGVVTVGAVGFAQPQVAAASIVPAAGSGLPAMFGLAMVFVLLTYGGWNEAAYVSAEIRGSRRAIVWALVAALALIALVYLVFVLGAFNALGLEGMKTSKAVGAEVMQRAFGERGEVVLSLIVALATLTSINATMLVGARTNYALGRDWPALAFMSGWNAARGVPVRAFLVQAVLSLGLVAFGAFQKDGFSAMVEFTAPVFWFFFMLTGVALFVLRFREPHVARPFKVPGYPILPIVFVLTCGYLFYSSVTYAQSQQAVHVALGVMAAGAAAWILMRLLGRAE